MENNNIKNRILVVDDNLSGLYLTTKNLRLEGYDILEASSGFEALDKVLLMPDVVLLDVKLPDINGFEVCRRIKADPRTCGIPVIHLSATYLDNESKIKGLNTGADAYLTHPVEPKVLSATIEAMMRIKRAEARYQEIALQWKSTFDSISDALCLVNASGNVIRCNQAFTGLPGMESVRIPGLPLSSLVPEFASYTPEYFHEYFLRKKDENWGDEEKWIFNKWFLVGINAVTDNMGLYQGSVFRMTDITGLKNTQSELNSTLKELGRSNEELELFAYIASHDLKEPLRMVTSYTQLLLRKHSGQLEGEASEYAGFITKSIEKMHNLINDLLMYSRVKTRQKNFTSVNMNQILQDALLNLSLSIKETGTQVTYDSFPDVKGDPVQLLQVFQNLIGNAIKFRKKDERQEIHIGVKPVGKEYEFCVSDKGIGIEKEFFERIFVIFQQLNDREAYPGTGLGLAICKKIIQRHGGSIRVESEFGKGATFYFTLPV